MSKKMLTLFLTLVFTILLVIVCTVPCFATFYMAGHYDPDGTTTTCYAYSSGECNRKINVSFYDTSGAFLKKVVIHTKRGEDNSFHIGIGGYDIVKFESNQGLWETCKMVWTSGSGLCDEADLFVNYYFRTALSKDELNITVTMRKWDPIKFEVRHYVEKDPTLKFFHRENYRLYTTTNQTTLNYYDYFSTSKINITGYTLTEGYQASVSGRLCIDKMAGSIENLPTSPRCYEYDLVHTSYSEPMKSVSKYDESKDGKLDYCQNRKFWVEYLYDIKEYTVTYNANGGTGAPETQTKYHGYTLTLSENIPTRSGYTFKGWGTSSGDTTPDYQPGAAYTANSGKTLYAIWESNAKKYTVSYNANGGYGAPVAQVKTHDVPLRLAYGEPYRTGYTFLGWGLSSSSTAPAFMPGDMFDKNRNVTLYAVWQSNAPVTHKVTFNANGGSAAPPAVTVVRGENLTLTKEPTRSNYRFLGWNTYPTASVPVYLTGGTIMAITKDMVLYAVWEYDPVSYTVIYNANGGSGAPPAQTKFYGIGITLSDVTPKRDGYDFLGWAQSSTATVAQYAPGDSYTSNANLSLYAVWQKTNYDFSVSDLSVSDNEPYRYGQITVKVKADSWDKRNSYTDIPVQIYYDGRLMSTQYVDFAAYGVANLTFTLYVGDTPGNRPIEARINWANRGNETNTGNNTVSTSIHVKDFDYEVSIDEVTMSDQYAAGETVITSFTVRNDSDHDIIPDSQNNAVFTAYFYNGLARFPEFNYLDINGNFRTLVYVNGKYMLAENADAAGNERIHFIPVWFEDGEYVVSVTATRVWTPVGMITAVRNVSFTVAGTIYDDWYHG